MAGKIGRKAGQEQGFWNKEEGLGNNPIGYMETLPNMKEWEKIGMKQEYG